MLAVAAAFWRVLSMPLLHDSYGHVYTAGHESLPQVLRMFTSHPEHGDFFFRPLGYLSFWIDAHWAGASPLRWHAWSVFLHLLNTALVYVLARRVSFQKFASLSAALFFGLHGSRPEAVAWVAARFDLLAAFFSLLALYCATRYFEHRIWPALLTVFTAAALLNKESAYCLPLLVPGVLLLRSRERRISIPSALVLLTCAATFLYRTWIVRGIGGYGAEAGSPAILHFSLIRSLNALFFREWALLFFPVNWSESPGAGLALGVVAGVAALVFAIVAARGSRFRYSITLALIVGAALPVEHLLLIGSDLSGARVLYLPVLGLALFWAAVIEGIRVSWARAAVLGLLLWFQIAALEHNLAIWGTVARTSQRTCAFLAHEIEQSGSPIAVVDPPATLDGVYFLKNSLPACVLLNSGGALQQLPEITGDEQAAKRVFRWNSGSEALSRQP